jgi:hypothetical protein
MEMPTSERVQLCYRCGLPAEDPLVGSGHVAGQDEGHMPLCIGSLGMVLKDPKRFWEGMRERQE